ncbi:MAG TPA: chemotaxis protein CheB [Steroidobacteraceae bacterium]|nr:chemotaxis protein CheB [Steroidobacteraceae bacterium]
MKSADQDPGTAAAATPSGAPDEASAPIDFTARAALAFPVVGVGASAGGVEALRTFFAACSPEGGMAYVVIQHLSPEHESLMAEILGRCTLMPVRQIEDGMLVEPNRVYVIRPGHTVTLAGGALHLGEPVEKRGHRRPVDDFFRSLAREQQERAIAVVLSGTGTNGTAGAQAIKAAGGLCIAQDPETAEFPQMPQSLIHAGYADQVLKVEDVPAVLLRYTRHPGLELPPAGGARAAQELERHRQQLNEVIAIVRARTGHDFGAYKPPTVLRRIQRRMGLAGIRRLEDYGARLRDHSEEAAALANDLMINVTGFFRDPAAWEALREAVVQPLIEQYEPGSGPLRAWVAACASGEEPYTLAMLIAEEAERAGKNLDVKIFATDTADKSLVLARAGVYPGGIEGNLSPERLEKFFDKEEHTYRIKKVLREQVVFAPQDLLTDPPFSRVDIVACRNLLIYLEPEAQRRVLTLLHFALREGGYLFLGNAETLGHADTLFEVVSKRWRIYRRTGPTHRFAELPALSARMPAVRTAGRVAPVPIVRASGPTPIQAALLEELPPTAVVDANERVVYFQGDTTPFLLHPSGEATQNLLELVRVPLRSAARSALRQSFAEKRPITVQTDSGEDGSHIAITAAPLKHRHPTQHFRVSFQRMEQASGQGAAVSEHPLAVSAAQAVNPLRGDPLLEEELRQVRAELQASLEAFEASTEELKASNEEVTSVNEELQSANEELETSKEELQALNEELVTVNAQLQSKVLELEALTDDLHNLLSSTDIAVVFLDRELTVRRFTPAMSDLLELIPADIGRPLAHFAPKFSGGELMGDARQVMAKLVPLESEVLSHSGRWYLMRTLPYRTEDNHIAGVVITFIDLTARKQAEQAITASQERLRAVIEQLPAAVLVAEAPAGNLLLGNRQAAQLFNQPFPLPFIGHSWTVAYSLFRGFHKNAQPYAPREWPLARALETGEEVLEEELDFVRPDGTAATVTMSAAPIRNAAGEVTLAVATFWDITHRKALDARLQEALQSARQLQASAEHANRAKDEFISTVSHELRTPLNTIRLWSRMFMAGTVHDADVIRGGQMVDRAALAQQQLIDDLLDVSRMASGQLRLAPRDTPLATGVAAAIESIRPVAEGRRVVLASELSAEVGSVYVDPDRIQQVVWNLLANAVKFTPEGGRVDVRLRRVDGTVQIEVTDTGKGIRADFLPHVFDRFRQGDGGAARRFGGLGLGLAIAKQLVELHGGTITAHSEGEGRGATFTVYLPLERRYPTAEQTELADARRESKVLTGLDVLLVEDESMAREASERLLEQYGAQVRAVGSAAGAREAFEARRPDVIVADIGMPDEDGYALIKHLRRLEQERHSARVPAVAATAFARSEDRQRALAAGFDEHLPKPVDPEQLVRVLVRLTRAGRGR